MREDEDKCMRTMQSLEIGMMLVMESRGTRKNERTAELYNEIRGLTNEELREIDKRTKRGIRWLVDEELERRNAKDGKTIISVIVDRIIEEVEKKNE